MTFKVSNIFIRPALVPQWHNLKEQGGLLVITRAIELVCLGPKLGKLFVLSVCQFPIYNMIWEL